MPQSPATRFTADPLTFIVRHQLWDANVEDHSDQGVSIEVAADVDGRETVLLRFNCFDLEKSYVYGPENPELTTPGRVGGGTHPVIGRLVIAVLAVAEVHSGDVHSGFDQRPDRFVSAGGRTESTDNLAASRHDESA